MKTLRACYGALQRKRRSVAFTVMVPKKRGDLTMIGKPPSPHIMLVGGRRNLLRKTNSFLKPQKLKS
jgi:hypothetical protein